MIYVVLDNDEKLTDWPTEDEAIAYVAECRLEDEAENDVECHRYLIKPEECRASAAAKVRARGSGIAWRLFMYIGSMIAGCIGVGWFVTWWLIKCAAGLIAYIVLGVMRLVLYIIKCLIALIIAIIAITSICLS